MTPKELEEIKARAEAATPGPWEENWKPIPVALNYEVSDFGNVRSKLKKGNHRNKVGQEWRLLSQSSDRGYRSVSLPVAGHYRRQFVHRLVLLSFIGPCPDGMEVAHLNGNPSDNRLENLKYCSHKDNESHKKAHGTCPIGESNGQSVMQGWQVAEIKYLASKSVPQGKIASLFDISHKLVSAILTGSGWVSTPARTDVPALVAEVEELNRQRDEAYQNIETLFFENKRLRGLLKESEWQDTRIGTNCIYCSCDVSQEHTPSCPAFTPEGEVK